MKKEKIITTDDKQSLKWNMIKSLRTKNRQNLEQILNYSNASPIRAKFANGYTCECCDAVFPKPYELKSHFIEHHKDRKRMLLERATVVKLDVTNLMCTICGRNMPQLKDLMIHLEDEHNKEMHRDIKHEILPFNFESDSYKCVVCSIDKSNFKLLQEHMNMHFRNYVCSLCSRGFVSYRLLKNHINRHGNGKVSCEMCDKTFDSEQKKTDHFGRVHLKNARNICHLCGERFTDYWKKINHQVAEHSLPPVVLKCQACDRNFDNQRALRIHTKRDHLMEKRFKCSNCDMAFFKSGSLKKHMLKHTGLKLFKCDVCLKSYGLKNTLREHMRIHNNDRRFTCAHCGQMFVQKCSWRAHVRTKHGETV